MKKTIITLVAGAALIAAATASGTPKQYGQVQKPFEVSAGAMYFLGDLNDLADFTFGFTAGVDYYMSQMGQGSSSFVGVRGWFGSKSGFEVTTYGAHYGVKFGLQQGQMNKSGDLYVKLAGGFYNTSFSPGNDKWGFGGFVGLGYDVYGQAGGTPFGMELGYQLGPSNSGVNNQGVYGVVTFRF
ncbi:MAG: hypothetical protein KIT74_05295 [Fimbriimonadales bacterium]|nr:hypothetical protein [Fimbriimonadales bacterium]